MDTLPTDQTPAVRPAVNGPLVSVIMANFRGEAYIADAIASVLRQTHAELELIVADDCSGDGSVVVVRAAMARDPRVRLIEAAQNAGPGVARSRALDAARGDWVAIMDSDDLIHPDRLRLLLAAADRLGADLVADDMVYFGATPDVSGRSLLGAAAPATPLAITAAVFVQASLPGSTLPPLGYLKPLIRRAAIGSLRYDPTLRIGEDHDFYLRLILGGARFMLLPDALYLYRRHAASISHRLSVGVAQTMLAAHERVMVAAHDPVLAVPLRQRRGELVRILAYERLVAAIKARCPGDAARMLLARPGLLVPLGRSVTERLARRGQASAARTPYCVVLADPAADLPLGKADERLAVPGGLAVAVRLSALSARHDLHVVAVGRAGVAAAWLAPRIARFTLIGDAPDDLPLPVATA